MIDPSDAFYQRLGDPDNGGHIPPFRPPDTALPLGHAAAAFPGRRLLVPVGVGHAVELIGIQPEGFAGDLVGVERHIVDRAVTRLAKTVGPRRHTKLRATGQPPEEFLHAGQCARRPPVEVHETARDFLEGVEVELAVEVGPAIAPPLAIDVERWRPVFPTGALRYGLGEGDGVGVGLQGLMFHGEMRRLAPGPGVVPGGQGALRALAPEGTPSHGRRRRARRFASPREGEAGGREGSRAEASDALTGVTDWGTACGGKAVRPGRRPTPDGPLFLEKQNGIPDHIRITPQVKHRAVRNLAVCKHIAGEDVDHLTRDLV